MKRTALMIAAVSLTAALLGACSTPEESSGVYVLNGDRGAWGLHPLENQGSLVIKAQNWARHLADHSGGQCSMATLSHSHLPDGAPEGWRRLGENVGCRIAPGDLNSHVGALQVAFMNSPSHRDNILNRDFTHVGIGLASAPAAIGNGWLVVYEAQEFARL